MREPDNINEAAKLLMKFDKPNFGVETQRKKFEKNSENQVQEKKDDASRKKFNEYTNARQSGNGWWGRKENEARKNDPKLRAIQEDERQSTSDDEDSWEEEEYVPDETGQEELEEERRVDSLEEIKIGNVRTIETGESKACPTITISMEDRDRTALLDTGAQVSAVSDQAVSQWTSEGLKLRTLPAPSTMVRGALGEKTKINKQILLEFGIKKENLSQPCVAVKSLSNDIILGFDFIKKYGVIIDPVQSSAMFTTLNETVSLQNSEEQLRLLETLTEDEPSIEEKEQAFERIKQSFRDAEELYLMRENPQLGMESDASNKGLGARLFQKDPGTGTLETIAYCSRALKPAEKKYTVTELEGLAVVWALKKWHIWLAERPITVRTDHQALTFIQTCPLTSNRLSRWIMHIQQYDVEWQHIEGKENKYADYLSRYTQKTHQEQEKQELMLRLNQLQKEEPWKRQQRQIIQQQAKGDWVKGVIKDAPIKRDSDGLMRVLSENQWKVPIPVSLTKEVAIETHKFIMHFGTDKLYEFLKDNSIMHKTYWHAREVAASCDHCHKTKHYNRPSEGKQYFNLPTDIHQIVAIDIFGPLPTSRLGNKYVLVMQDLFSKAVYLSAMKRITAPVICRHVEKYIESHEVLTTFLTDNARQFVSRDWKALGDQYGCELRTTSPYNPQSNPVERCMRDIGRTLRSSCTNKHTTWDKIIKKLQLCLNSTVHRSNKAVPAEIEGTPKLTIPCGLESSIQDHDKSKINKKEVLHELQSAAEKRNQAHANKKQTIAYQTVKQSE